MLHLPRCSQTSQNRPIEPPSEGIDPAVFDPFQTPELAAVQALTPTMFSLTGNEPRSTVGAPSFRVGKKTFVRCISTKASWN